MQHGTRRSLWLVPLVLAFVGFGFYSPPATVLGCTDCVDDCEFGRHESTSDLLGGWELEIQSHANTHGCDDGACSDYHAQTCEQNLVLFVAPPTIELGEAIERLQEAPLHKIDEVVADFSAFAIVNQDRRSLQFYGCSGDVIAHVPLSPAALDVIRRAD